MSDATIGRTSVNGNRKELWPMANETRRNSYDHQRWQRGQSRSARKLQSFQDIPLHNFVEERRPDYLLDLTSRALLFSGFGGWRCLRFHVREWALPWCLLARDPAPANDSVHPALGRVRRVIVQYSKIRYDQLALW
jgi:hypothetical protein